MDHVGNLSVKSSITYNSLQLFQFEKTAGFVMYLWKLKFPSFQQDKSRETTSDIGVSIFTIVETPVQ